MRDKDVDQTADFVDAQPDRVPLSVIVVAVGAGGAVREDGEGGQGESGEAVPGVPLADLVLVETDLAFRGLEALFHDPAGSGDVYEPGEAGWFGCPAAVEGQLTGGAVASDEQTVPAVGEPAGPAGPPPVPTSVSQAQS